MNVLSGTKTGAVEANCARGADGDFLTVKFRRQGGRADDHQAVNLTSPGPFGGVCLRQLRGREASRVP